MKKTLFRMLLLLLTLCLLAAPVTALAAEAEEPLPTAEPGTDPMEDARALMKELGEQLRTGGKDLLDGIRATLQSIDTRELMDRLGNIFQNTRDLTDEELAERLRSLAEDTHVELTDAQVETLVKLCRRLEGLDREQLQQKVEDIKSAVRKAGEAAENALETKKKADGFLRSLRDFFRQAEDWLTDLLGDEDQ